MSIDEIKAVFYPRKLAVVGVSESRDNMGKYIVQNLIEHQFKGDIYPVGPKGGIISGLKIYSSVSEIPVKIDYAAMITPARTVPELVGQCGMKGAKVIYIATGGFRELKEENIELENEILKQARKYGTRIVGPNCIGVINSEIGLCLPFSPLPKLKIGPVSILSQSGGVANSYLMCLTAENIGINKWVSMGNKLDLNELNFLSYLIQDPWTQIICIHSEGLDNGNQLLKIARSSDKPIILHKVNRYDSTTETAKSHTSAIANDDRIVDALCQQGPVLRAKTIQEAVNYSKAFLLPKLTGNRLAIISRSGGHGVIATDFCAEYDFEMPAYDSDYLKNAEEFFKAKVVKTANPLDLGDLWDFESYRYLLENAIKQNQFDGMLFIFAYNILQDHELMSNMAFFISDLMEKYNKPIAFVLHGWQERVDRMKQDTSFPIFSEIGKAVQALSISRDFFRKKKMMYI